jgi:hypothetical protein
MGIEDDFYATVKLKSGEEIFAKVAASEEEDRTLLIVTNPIIVNEIKSRIGVVGYKLEPWLKTTKDDMFILNMSDVLTMSESSDVEMYQSFVRDSNADKTGQPKLSRKMGFISTVNDAKEILEKIYKSS